ncbi:hypothetical protein AN478_07835 [Thiohalorhabdus denitrificans]|nr:outer membrane protein transport protein [Thiohalorhabdus denitrificans]KPV40062.1 hypothetical protein AN478_07835 [Thiohalorhabdus denitrificans]
MSAASASATGFKEGSRSAEGLGVANALGADAEHVSSMAYNPAALAFQDGRHVQASLTRPYMKMEAPASGNSRPDTTLYPSSLYATYRSPASAFGLGLAVDRPYRMDSEWDFGEADAATRTELDLVDVNPTVSYRLRPDLALSVGADYYRALDFEYSSVASDGSSEVVRTGDGDAWGGTVGLMFWRESWSLAATFSSGADLTLAGDNLEDYDFRLPSEARIGFKYRPSLRWSVHLDAVRTGWDEYDGLEGVDPTGKDWDATVGYKAGAIARLSDRSEIRFGYSYQPDPKDDTTFDPRSPSGDEHLLTVGGGWRGKNLTMDVAYTYAISPSRHVDGAAVGAYDGRHRTNAQYLMFSLGWSNF